MILIKEIKWLGSKSGREVSTMELEVLGIPELMVIHQTYQFLS